MIIVRTSGIEFSLSEKPFQASDDLNIKQALFATASIQGDVTGSFIQSVKQGNTRALQRTGIQFVCDTSSDYEIILAAFLFLSIYPDASKMLWHYLTGKGEEVEVNTERVFNEDPVLKLMVFKNIGTDIKAGKTSGSVNVEQGVYSNQNWRMAFGSINVPWKINNNDIEIWIKDKYALHPLQTRVTQCVHQTMERTKKYGAMDFDYKGTIMKVPKNRIVN